MPETCFGDHVFFDVTFEIVVECAACGRNMKIVDWCREDAKLAPVVVPCECESPAGTDRLNRGDTDA